jgi:FkbM family methyltransferase
MFDRKIVNEAANVAHAGVYFGQFAEDVIIWRTMQIRRRLSKPGFYVDVGAHHPTKTSNTYLLHKYFGWRGINIDPNEELIKQFSVARPLDINVCCAISSRNDTIGYHRFKNAAVNTIVREQADFQMRHPAHELQDVVQVEALPLSDVLSKYLPPGVEIDLLDVDVEGADLDVLQSNDWAAYRPFLICVEDSKLRLDNVEKSDIYRFLNSKRYLLSNFSVMTAFYVRKD